MHLPLASPSGRLDLAVGLRRLPNRGAHLMIFDPDVPLPLLGGTASRSQSRIAHPCDVRSRIAAAAATDTTTNPQSGGGRAIIIIIGGRHVR